MPFSRVQPLWRVPLSRWPLHWHGVLALLLVGGLAFAAWFGTTHTSHFLAQQKAQTLALQAQLQALQDAPSAARNIDFVQTLPPANRADDLARDINRFAQEIGVQITSVSIEPRAATATEVGRVHFNVAAQAPYKASKAWLAELLSRYPSLGVANLSLQVPSNDPTRQDVRVALVWFVKD